MLLSISLDRPHAVFTNLDEITGKVFLRLTSNTTVSAVVVKLEGESKTRLADPNDRKKAALEVHKLLYKREVLFPSQQLQDEMQAKQSFTLNVGNYEYPFSFKLPFNNACNTVYNPSGSLMNELVSPILQQNAHIKATLPPSMSGFPGEADVSYFIKKNYFTFLPIEPPQQAGDGESYARRQHQFFKRPNTPTRKDSGSGSLFGKKKTTWDSDPPDTPAAMTPPARFSADVRLPNPAILTCGQPLPLKILVKKLSDSREPLYLKSLQIELIGYTLVRAQMLNRRESSSWVIFSRSNMAEQIGSVDDPEGTETAISSEYWSGYPLPNTVAPSFQACNLGRKYDLQVLVGLGYATTTPGKDQFVVLPLRLSVTIYSGIHPPKELLAAMDSSSPSSTDVKRPIVPPRRSVTGPSGAAPAYSPAGAPSASVSSPTDPVYEDAPPSYEDAVGSNMPPVPGPRGDYAPPPSGSDDARFGDVKRR